MRSIGPKRIMRVMNLGLTDMISEMRKLPRYNGAPPSKLERKVNDFIRHNTSSIHMVFVFLESTMT